MRHDFRALLPATIACLCTLAHVPHAVAEVNSFRIRLLASNQDGDAQIIELEEVDGKDGQHQLGGLTIAVTNRYGITKKLVLPSDLPPCSGSEDLLSDEEEPHPASRAVDAASATAAAG